MADGNELLTEYQYGFRDLVFGAQTDIIVEKMEGLLSMSDVKLSEEDKQDDHGSHPDIPLGKGRTLDFDVKVVGQAGVDIEDKLATVRRVFQLPRKRYGRISEPFTFWRPGQPKKMALVRCIRRDFTSEFSTARGIASGSVELYASDPLYYSVVQSEEEVELLGSILSAVKVVNQAGDYADGSWPVLTITGPAVNPVIRNVQDDARAVRLDLNIPANSVAVIDAKREIVWLDGVRSSAAIRSDNEWWALLPGTNEIQYSRSSGSLDSILTIKYRDAWQ